MNLFFTHRLRVSLQFATFSFSTTPSSSSNLRAFQSKLSDLIHQGRIDDARKLFDEMPERDTRSWNSMISGYVKRRKLSLARNLFDEMPDAEKNLVSWNIMISGYVACHGCGARFIDEGRRLFDRMPDRDLVSWNTVISGYGKIGRMDEAVSLFEAMPSHDVVSWSTMITGFLRNRDVAGAIEWFGRMPVKGGESVGALVAGLVRIGELDKACSVLMSVDVECEDMVYAYNALIAGYGNRGRIGEAERVFDWIRSKFARNLVSWNTMIMCYVKSGDMVSARRLFDEMPERDIFSWNTVITGYVRGMDMARACEVFSGMPNPDVVSWNAMVSGYARVGNLGLALSYFRKMPEKSVVSWNSMIAGLECNGELVAGVSLFKQMLLERESPDRHTFSSLLSISTSLVALDLGMQIHQMATKTAIPDLPLNNALLTMYSRCGALTEAQTVFETTKFHNDVVTWNAMIDAYSSHGYSLQALHLFESMKNLNITPTEVTFVSVLNTCAHAGLLVEGRECLKSMVSDFGLELKIEHLSAIVSSWARFGRLREAMELVYGVPRAKTDKNIWGMILNGCRLHNEVELARVAAGELVKLDPEGSAAYVLVYNMCVELEKWDEAAQVRKVLERNGIKKDWACSWI